MRRLTYAAYYQAIMLFFTGLKISQEKAKLARENRALKSRKMITALLLGPENISKTPTRLAVSARAQDS